MYDLNLEEQNGIASQSKDLFTGVGSQTVNSIQGMLSKKKSQKKIKMIVPVVKQTVRRRNRGRKNFVPSVKPPNRVGF